MGSGRNSVSSSLFEEGNLSRVEGGGGLQFRPEKQVNFINRFGKGNHQRGRPFPVDWMRKEEGEGGGLRFRRMREGGERARRRDSAGGAGESKPYFFSASSLFLSLAFLFKFKAPW